MSEQSPVFPRAGFFRRLAAMIYDVLVAVAVAVVAALVMLTILVLLTENGVLDKQGHEHFMDLMQSSLLYTSILQIWVALWVLGFYIWFWRNGGQTLGMRAWRLRIMPLAGERLSYQQIVLRLIFSLGGLGTLLVLLDFKHKQSLQDRIAKTQVLALSKEANHHKSWRSL